MRLFLAAFLLVGSWLAARAAGLADHVAVIAGMPISEASWTLGPAYLLLTLLAVVVAPILALTGLLDLLARRLSRR